MCWTRDDAAGRWKVLADWPPEEAKPPPQDPSRTLSTTAPAPAPIAAPISAPDVPLIDAPAVDGAAEWAGFEERLLRSLVLADVDIPLVALADGVHSRSFSGRVMFLLEDRKCRASTGLNIEMCNPRPALILAYMTRLPEREVFLQH